MAPKVLAGKVCIVTGASRGLGRGIALQLGEAGAKVYITGRTLSSSGSGVGGSLTETAKEIEDRGGKAVAVQCDHSKDADIRALFDRVSSENDGQLDILVNNAFAAVTAIAKYRGIPFYEQDLDMWDTVNNVGLRNHYVCCVLAARMMIPRKSGFIVNVSSPGGLKYLFNVPYGIGKQALDRMGVDCGIELRKKGVVCISLWPGPVKTEEIMADYNSGKMDPKTKAMFDGGETTEFAGKCIAALASDPNLMKKTARILLTAELGEEYGLKDIDGTTPQSIRQLKGLLLRMGYDATSSYTPAWIRLPYWLFSLAGNKF